MSETKKPGWLEAKADDLEFHRLLAREDLIEDFLHGVEAEMSRQRVSRSELARRMGCKPANVTRIMRRTTNLTAATMVDLAFALNLRLRVDVGPGSRKWFGFSNTSCVVIPFVSPEPRRWRESGVEGTPAGTGLDAVAS
jgi:ribosome-binding protein aMBF1 (putative translation factor)